MDKTIWIETQRDIVPLDATGLLDEWRPGWRPPHANRDPVSIVAAVASAVSSIGITGGPLIISGAFAGLTTAAVAVGTVITAGAAIGVAAALGAAQQSMSRGSFQDRGAFSAGVNKQEVRLTSRQEVPPRRWIYGEVLVGGPIFFEESKSPKYYRGMILSDGPIDSIVAVYNSETEITVDLTKASNMQALAPSRYVSRLKLSFRRGTENQTADPILLGAFPGLGNQFRQRGVATLCFEADWGTDANHNENMWGTSRRPNILVKARGVPVYDPGNPTHRLPDDPNDYEDYKDAQSTWDWSNNASLVQADYLWRPNGGRVPLHRMRWDEIARSAEYDQQLIGTKSGELIPRHTIDGVVTAGQQPLQVIQSMLSANRGFVVQSQGRVWVQSSQPQDAVLTITDALIVGGIEYRAASPKTDLVNRVRCRFIDPRQEWQTVDGPVRDRPDLRALDGDLYEAAIEMPWTADHRRAQRLAKSYLDQSRLGKAVTAIVSLDALARSKGKLDAGRVVRFDTAILPRANGLYRVDTMEFVENFSAIQLVMTQYDPSIDRDWNPETDEQDFTLPDLNVS